MSKTGETKFADAKESVPDSFESRDASEQPLPQELFTDSMDAPLKVVNGTGVLIFPAQRG